MAVSSILSSAVSTLAGQRSDWQLRRPRLPRLRHGIHWVGPLAIVGSVAVSWFAFANATGEGAVAFGLFIGAVSILLMAWSFVLAIRLRWLEPLFGGLDSMYRVHRWIGTLSVVAMFLHTSVEPEIEGGIRGASRSLADTAEDLAGTGQTMLYILIGLSLIRWFPYRLWRLTHKLLGIPFAFASFHFFTAEKPYANGSPWGWYFGAFMIAGLVAYIVRVVGRDVLKPGLKYTVTSVERQGTAIDIRLAPVDTAIQHRAGQFAALKVQMAGMREPHIFTIASPPDAEELRFFIRDLGDWTEKMQHADLVGAEVIVEGPYGQFAPFGHGRGATVWVAGGVGITPFLSAAGSLVAADKSDRPTLHYLVRSSDDAMALPLLEELVRTDKLNLVVHASSEGNRFHASSLAEHHPDDLNDAHVAVCGPASLVTLVDTCARQLGAAEVEREDFDIRQGFGPDLSRQIANLSASGR